MSKERWIAEQLYCMDEVFDDGVHCEECPYKISYPPEDLSGEGHWNEGTRDCLIENDYDRCPGVRVEYHDGRYADIDVSRFYDMR
jgi:hypothetical protein